MSGQRFWVVNAGGYQHIVRASSAPAAARAVRKHRRERDGQAKCQIDGISRCSALDATEIVLGALLARERGIAKEVKA